MMEYVNVICPESLQIFFLHSDTIWNHWTMIRIRIWYLLSSIGYTTWLFPWPHITLNHTHVFYVKSKSVQRYYMCITNQLVKLIHNKMARLECDLAMKVTKLTNIFVWPLQHLLMNEGLLNLFFSSIYL